MLHSGKERTSAELGLLWRRASSEEICPLSEHMCTAVHQGSMQQNTCAVGAMFEKGETLGPVPFTYFALCKRIQVR